MRSETWTWPSLDQVVDQERQRGDGRGDDLREHRADAAIIATAAGRRPDGRRGRRRLRLRRGLDLCAALHRLILEGDGAGRGSGGGPPGSPRPASGPAAAGAKLPDGPTIGDADARREMEQDRLVQPLRGDVDLQGARLVGRDGQVGRLHRRADVQRAGQRQAAGAAVQQGDPAIALVGDEQVVVAVVAVRPHHAGDRVRTRRSG